MKIFANRVIAAVAAIGLFAAGAQAASISDLTATATDSDWTDSGAFVANVDPSGSQGTGVFEPFVRVQGTGQTTGAEKGFNTDGTPQFDTKGGIWTHSVAFTDMNFFSCADFASGDANCVVGTQYYLFVLDYNQNKSAGGILLSLDTLKIYDSLTASPANFDDGNLLFDLSGDKVLLNYEISSGGSGGGDFYIYIPLDLTGVDPYMVFYTEMGATTDYGGRSFEWNDGFEEWAFVVGPGCQEGDPNCDGDNVVPEPSSMLLMGGGLLGLAWWRRRKTS